MGSRFVYATGRLAVWSAKPGLVDDQGRVLQTDSQSRLALANPKLAPYGAAALEVLDRMGLAVRWQARLVQGENIAQAYQFVASGNAALGFVALSQVAQGGRFTTGSGWVVPAAWHSPLKQEAVLLKWDPMNPAPQAFMAFLKGEAARRIIASYGYEP
jgi:molybdate transport system substrate-binding protein